MPSALSRTDEGKNLHYLISLSDQLTDIHSEVRSLIIVAH